MHDLSDEALSDERWLEQAEGLFAARPGSGMHRQRQGVQAL